MFRNRRPTPSPQTIEFIRQLAYISGGALCGVTALYLEECRRRIQILQRVLDKRRTIVQVAQARRYSRVALAARSDAVDFEQVHASDHIHQSWGTSDEAVAPHTRPSCETDSLAIEAPESRARSTTYTPYGVAMEASANHDDRGNASATSEPRSEASRKFAPFVFAGRSTLDDSNSRIAPTGPQHGLDHLKQDIPHVHDTNQSRPLTRRQRVTLSRTSDQGRGLSPVRGVQSERGRATSSLMKARSQMSQSEMISKRIATLIERHRTEQDGVSVKVSAALLPHALRIGTLGDISRLCNWMIQNGTFTIGHGKLLVESCPHLAKTFSSKDMFSLYASVLNASRFGVSEPEEVFRLKFKFLVHALDWHVSHTPTDYGLPILGDKDWSLGAQTKAEIVNTECRYLLSDMQIDRAADLFLIATRCSWAPQDSSVFSKLSYLADDIMQSAIDEDLESYKRLLQWKRGFQAPHQLKQQFNTFVEACGRQRLYQLLAEFIIHRGRGWSTSSLMNLTDGLNKAIVAVAFSVNVQLVTTFPDVYRKVPEPFRQYVDEFASVESLRAKWKAEHNTELIESEALKVSTMLEKQGNEKTLLKVDEVMLEIYVIAGNHDKALECIARMHKIRQGDVQFLALAAVYFSSKWAWDGLARLLEISKSYGTFTFDEHSTRLFNTAIRTYSQAHSPLETWTFVTNAIDELGFLPNFATLQTMLFKIVQEKSIDLIPRWLRFMCAIGSSFDITGYLAAGMIRQYWLWNRQPSDLLFWLCHRLTVSVPHFNTEHFRETLKMAVGHDLRYGSGGGDAYMVQKEALTHFEQLNTAEEVVPLPGITEQQTSDMSVSPSPDYHTTDAPQQTSHHSEQRYYQTLASFNDEIDPDQEEQIATLDAEAKSANEGVEDPFRRRAHASRGQEERMRAKKRLRTIDIDMTTAISLTQYQEALDIYHGSCDAAGVPASVYALKNAIHASISLHQGGTAHAEKLLADAKQSGMDVHRAMEPLLVHRSSNLAINDVREARRVCDATTEYYEENHRNGYPVKFALAHTVANTLTVRGHAEEALRLLSTIFQSDYIKRMMPSIKTMSVWIKAYAQLLSTEGIRWVTMRVLSKNLIIDSVFLHDFGKAARQPFAADQQKLIRSWLRQCEERRKEQDLEAKIFGNQLVDCIVGYVHKYARVGRPARPDDDPDQDIIEGIEKVDKGRAKSASVGSNGLKKDRPQHQPRIARRRRRSVARAKAERPRPDGKLTVHMLAPFRKQSIVRKVSDPGLDTSKTPADLRSEGQTTFVPFF